MARRGSLYDFNLLRSPKIFLALVQRPRASSEAFDEITRSAIEFRRQTGATA